MSSLRFSALCLFLRSPGEGDQNSDNFITPGPRGFIFTPQSLRLWGIVITKGGWADGADACKRDNLIFSPHVHDIDLKAKLDIQ